MKSSDKGFSLIELIIAIVIAGIITAVAWPSYTSYVEQSRNAEAKNALLNIAALQHQYFTENRTYTLDVNDLNLTQHNSATNKMKTASGDHLVVLMTTEPLGITRYYNIKSVPMPGVSNGGLRYSLDAAGIKKHKISDSNPWENGW